MVGAVRDAVGRGFGRWRGAALPIVQCALSAGLAWMFATLVIGHAHPFFAPIAAVVCLGVSLGQRLRRVGELVVGVSVGVGVGDALISWIGSGPWQIALVVALAMSAAVLLDGGSVIALQAGSSAVLVATLLPPSAGGGFDRMIDALTGGLVGLAVAALIPANPVTVAQRQLKVLTNTLSGALRDLAGALDEKDSVKAAGVLAELRTSQTTIDDYKAALQTGREITRIAPIRWRSKDELKRYQTAAGPVDYAIRNTRVLARRSMAALKADERIPDGVPDVLKDYADAVDCLKGELEKNKEPKLTREAVRDAARVLTARRLGGDGFSSKVVLAQIRSVAVDLLQATGLSRSEAMEALPPLSPPADAKARAEESAPARDREDRPGRTKRP
ncbi:FUSC family protein [Lentzea sp. BCCO 10_0798]|uniref:FUSC family protein n=1 Tax=Lentzea kristufekii TaxID=3095430 RepID=A0ABU4TM98_9PSEU|nr:FUSC family protein [Lentzea sp. BCCO 10_0798]MDX8049184.1 FUSC family protein [Lentzea sp. BCCO 10_0798]